MKNGKKLVFGISLISQLISYIGAIVLLVRKQKGAAKLLAFFGAVATVLTLAALEKENTEETSNNAPTPEKSYGIPSADSNSSSTPVTEDSDKDGIDAAIGILKSTLCDDEENLLEDMAVETTFNSKALEDYTTPDELAEEAEKLAEIFEKAAKEEI